MNPQSCSIQLRGVQKHYRLGRTTVPAINDLDLDIQTGSFTVLSGPSGSGKSTALNLIGGLDKPDTGHILLEGTDLAPLDDDALTALRARMVGFVFQSFNLIPVLSAEDNVALALAHAGVGSAESKRRARQMLGAVGLEGMGTRLPTELSGGQQQRVAIARALVHGPRIVLADEPTANLDRATGRAIIELMRQMQRQTGVTFVFSSHDAALIAEADIVVRLVDGRMDSQTVATVSEGASS